MNKFCLRFENLPANIFFEGKEEVLRAQLWHQLGRLIYDGESSIDKVLKYASTAANMFGIQSDYLNPEPMKETDYHVTDIDFAMKDIGMTKTLFEMSEIRKEI